jgi:hypothetical protein
LVKFNYVGGFWVVIMNKILLLLFFTPLMTLASYPIYEEDVGSLQPELHAPEQKKAPPPISKRDAPKRNSVLQSKKPHPKRQQHPDRPRVIYRDSEKKSQDLSKIEADAENIEEGSATPQEEEWADQENEQEKKN